MLGNTFFVSFSIYHNKNLKNNISKIIFIFTNIILTTLICIFIKFIFPANNLVLNIYNNNFIYFILNLILFSLFFTTINIEKLNLKIIFLFYLIIFSSKYCFVTNFNDIFLSNFIIYFIFILINLFSYKKYINFIHTLDFSGKTNFLLFFLSKIDLKSFFDFFNIFFSYGNLAFKGFQDLFIIFLINKYGILNNSSSFLLINIILDLFFIPVLSIILNNLFYSLKEIKIKTIINTTTFCTIIQIIISIILYIFITNIVNLFNFETGIINYSIYIFKILSISIVFKPLQYTISAYCYSLKNKLLFICYYLLNIFIFGITIFTLATYKLNGILFSIPFSTIISNILFLATIKIFNTLKLNYKYQTKQ